MANGFEKIIEEALAKQEVLERQLNDKGCEFGRVTRMQADSLKKDFNGLGAKMSKVYGLLLGSTFTLIINLIVLIFMLLKK